MRGWPRLCARRVDVVAGSAAAAARHRRGRCRRRRLRRRAHRGEREARETDGDVERDGDERRDVARRERGAGRSPRARSLRLRPRRSLRRGGRAAPRRPRRLPPTAQRRAASRPSGSSRAAEQARRRAVAARDPPRPFRPRRSRCRRAPGSNRARRRRARRSRARERRTRATDALCARRSAARAGCRCRVRRDTSATALRARARMHRSQMTAAETKRLDRSARRSRSRRKAQAAGRSRDAVRARTVPRSATRSETTRRPKVRRAPSGAKTRQGRCRWRERSRRVRALRQHVGVIATGRCRAPCGARQALCMMPPLSGAGWSSLVARRAHNPKVVGSNPTPATQRLGYPAALGSVGNSGQCGESRNSTILSLTKTLRAPLCLAAGVAVLAAAPGLAQESPQKPAPTAEATQPIDEVIVRGRRMSEIEFDLRIYINKFLKQGRKAGTRARLRTLGPEGMRRRP